MQYAGPAGGQRGSVFAAGKAVPRRLDADQAHVIDRDVGVEDAHRIGAAADAGDYRIGLAPGELRHLLQAFLADHRLEIAHHHRVRVRPGDRADDVIGVVDICDPVAHGFVQRVFQRPRTRFDGYHAGTEDLHAVDVRRLAPDVLRTHIHHAFQAVAGRDRSRSHAVHAGARLGGDSRLAHAPCEHGLPARIVDFVGAGMVEVFALEVYLRTPEQTRPALAVIDGARTADIVLEVVAELGDEFRIAAVFFVRDSDFVERLNQGFGDEDAAVRPEMSTA